MNRPRSTRRSTNSRRVARRVRWHSATEALAPAPVVPLRLFPYSKIAITGALGILIGVLLAFFNTDWFYVHEFEITGARFLTADEIVRASGVRGYNIFFIEAANVERALARLPEVKSARAQTGMLDRVAVHIQEREPVVLWQRGAENYWVDEEGFAFIARGARADLPALRDLDAAALAPGARAPARAFETFRALRAAWGDSARVLEWSSARGIALTIEPGGKIYFGDASDMPGKVMVARAVIAQLKGKPVKFIDVGQGEPFFQ